MKKLLLVGLVAVLIGLTPNLASANLIQNSSFENYAPGTYFDNWTEYGIVSIDIGSVHTGSTSARLEDNPNYPYNSGVQSAKFNITEAGTYEFGAWFTLISVSDPKTSYNDDRTGATTNIYFTAASGLPNSYPNQIYDISGAPGTTWAYNGSYYYSNWIFIGGTFDVADAADVFNAELNIYLQNWDATISGVIVDDAIVQRVPEPVPEPATMLLLGCGLISLAAIGRRKLRKS
jgi:hypothetical protein